MLLDSYKPHALIFQITYDEAFEIWDRSGAMARTLRTIWPGLTLVEGRPNYQTFTGNGIATRTGLADSSVTIQRKGILDARTIASLERTYDLWREILDLTVLKRASTRVIYVKNFDTIKAANAELLGMELAVWPDDNVFDQPMDAELNGLEIAYRFEDKASFSLLRLKSEQVKTEVELDPEFFDEPVLAKTKIRLVIDFDRGLLGSVDAGKFRVTEWIKGFQHVLRRDLEKVLKGRRL
jgi:hypothetical protein